MPKEKVQEKLHLISKYSVNTTTKDHFYDSPGPKKDFMLEVDTYKLVLGK